jgi:hypothetical protein
VQRHRYLLKVSASRKPAASELLLRDEAPFALRFPASLTGSRASAGTAATASSVFSLKKNGTEFATITFGIGATTGTIVAASATIFATGDILSLVAPSVRDTTLADLSFALLGRY